MYPILFHIPGLGFPVRAFGVLVAAGFLLGSHLFTKLAARYGDDPREDPARYSRVTLWILIGVIFGARAMYVVVEMLRDSEVGRGYRESPLTMLAVWEGGLVMYGGMFGAIAAGMWSARREKVRAVHALDLGLVAGFVGQAVGRVGCFLVGDDYGRVVPAEFRDLPWPITLHVPRVLPDGSLFGLENAGQVLWATQNWMTIKALIVAFVGWQILKRRRYAGQVSLWIVLMYALLRTGVEFFRGDEIRGVWFGGAVSTSQVVSLVAALVAIVLLVKNRDASNPLPDARA